jgi:response regulator RpfG family c-di-GMP phosphodiesterase
MPLNKHAIMIVDDERLVLNSLCRVLKVFKQYDIIPVNSAREAFAILNARKVDLLISDQRMPDMQGVELLKRVYREHPDTIRILLSGYSDFDGLAGAVNDCEIYKFVSKPWDNRELINTIYFALRQKDLVELISEAVNKVLRKAGGSDVAKITTINEPERILVRTETQGRMFSGDELSDILDVFMTYLSDRDNLKGDRIAIDHIGGVIEKTQGKVLFTVNMKEGMSLAFEFLTAE